MTKSPEPTHEPRPEHDLSNLKRGVRRKYLHRAAASTNLVLIEPDVHKVFKSPKAVNDALRLVIELRKIR